MHPNPPPRGDRNNTTDGTGNKVATQEQKAVLVRRASMCGRPSDCVPHLHSDRRDGDPVVAQAVSQQRHKGAFGTLLHSTARAGGRGRQRFSMAGERWGPPCTAAHAY